MSWNVAAIAVSLGLVLVGCGKKDTPKAPEAQKTAPAEKPAEKPAEAPAEKPAEAPAEKPAEAPAEKPAEAPAEKPAEAPAEKPAEAPADPNAKPAEAPADPNAKPAEAPADPNAAPAAAVDRAQAVLAGLVAFSEGRVDESFASYAEGAVWAVPGSPEIQGKAAIIETMKGTRVAMPDMVIRPSHVFESNGKVIVVYVMKGTNTGPMGAAPATGKSVAVHGAMVLDFDEAGKIMRVTDFFDNAAVLTQLGVIPTPEGAPVPTPVALPEETEIVKAPANEANLATTNAVMAAMTATTFEAKLREVLAADFSMRDPSTGQTITGVDAVITNMKDGLFKMWPDYTATVQQCWSTGDWVICQVDNKGTYKGGIPGVEGKDQATRFASLDFMEYSDGKAKTYLSFANSMQIMEQLGAVPGAAPAPAPEGGAAPAPEGGAAPAPTPVARATASAPSGFVQIPSGNFTMGASPGDTEAFDFESPTRQVTISRAFWLQAREVTQGEYSALMGNNPSHFTSCGSNCPVEEVSWEDAVGYANALSSKEGLTPCYDAMGNFQGLSCSGYRLPTEAEWEYAARAGTTGSRYGSPGMIAWTMDNSNSTTHPVGQLGPNAWGLYDMLGNVSEWTHDWYGSYSGGAERDPTGASSGSNRVFRGSCWDNGAPFARASNRFESDPGYSFHILGFRLARSVP